MANSGHDVNLIQDATLKQGAWEPHKFPDNGKKIMISRKNRANLAKVHPISMRCTPQSNELASPLYLIAFTYSKLVIIFGSMSAV